MSARRISKSELNQHLVAIQKEVKVAMVSKTACAKAVDEARSAAVTESVDKVALLKEQVAQLKDSLKLLEARVKDWRPVRWRQRQSRLVPPRRSPS